jgi:hypothetical protein
LFDLERIVQQLRRSGVAEDALKDFMTTANWTVSHILVREGKLKTYKEVDVIAPDELFKDSLDVFRRHHEEYLTLAPITARDRKEGRLYEFYDPFVFSPL